MEADESARGDYELDQLKQVLARTEKSLEQALRHGLAQGFPEARLRRWHLLTKAERDVAAWDRAAAKLRKLGSEVQESSVIEEARLALEEQAED